MGKGRRPKKPGGSSASNSNNDGSSIGGTRQASSSTRRGTSNKSGGERITRSSRAKLTNGLEDPAQVEKELNIQLRSMGLYAANTMGDGNCLFRALSDQLYGYPHQHGILREQVCDYLATKADKFAAFIDVEKPFEEYVRTMRQSGTYGGHLELSAFAQLQQKEIKIVQPGLVYIVSGDDESPQATKEREKKERERQLIQSQTIPGSEGPPPSERELRRLRREKKLKGLQEEEEKELGESSKMALKAQSIVSESVDEQMKGKEKIAEAFGPLYIAYHNWEHYSSIRNVDGPHTGLPRIRESHGSSSNSTKESSIVQTEEELEKAEPTEEEALVLRSTTGYSLEQVRFYIKRHGGWEEAMEAILAQDAVEDDDETEEEDIMNTSAMTVMSSPDDAARADEAAGPSLNDLSATTSTLMGDNSHYNHTPLLDHLRDWRAASPSSVDTIGTHSSLEGGSTSTHATTDESPETNQQQYTKRSKRAASKDLAYLARSPKRRSRSRSPTQQVPATQVHGNLDGGTLTTQDLDALHVRGTPTESEVEISSVREPSKLRVSSTKPLTMRERRLARQEEKAKRAIEAKNKRRERKQAANEENNSSSLTSAPHVRGFLELKI